MRKVEVMMHGTKAGILEEIEKGKKYTFTYDGQYMGPPVSLTMPVRETVYEFNTFPPFFEGLLPEGVQLEGLLRICKIDRHDLFSQLTAVGEDMTGAVTVREIS